MPFNIDLAMLLYISLAKLPNLSSNYKHPDLVLNTFPSKKAKKTFFISHSGGYVRLYLYDKNPSGKIGWAIGQLAYNSAPDPFIGLSATIPLGNEAAKARLRRARLVTLEQTMYRGIDEIINIISGLSYE